MKHLYLLYTPVSIIGFYYNKCMASTTGSKSLSLSDYCLNLIQNEALLYFRANNGPINSINCSFNDQEMQPVHFIQTRESSFSTLIELNVPLNQGEFWYNCSVSSKNIFYNPSCQESRYCVNSVACFVDTYFKGIC